MVAKRPFRVAVVGALLALMISAAFGQSIKQANDPTAPKRTANQKEGLFDFALKRVNSSDRDYGQCIAEGRKMLLEESIESGYFWSNLISLGLLGCLLVISIHQHKVQGRRELIVSESLAQYQHALARADVQIQEATSRNRVLMETLSSSIHRDVRSEPVEQQPKIVATVVKKEPAQDTRTSANARASVSTSDTSHSCTKPSPTVADKSAGVSSGGIKDSAANPTIPPTSLANVNPEVDLIARINVIQQQLTSSQEKEKQLRRQLNDAELRLQKEQQKNRSLKA